MGPTTHDELEAVFVPEPPPTVALGPIDLAWLVDEVSAGSTTCEPARPIELPPDAPGPVTIALRPFEPAPLAPAPVRPSLPPPPFELREVAERDALAELTPPAPQMVARFPEVAPAPAPRARAELRLVLVAALALALGVLLGALIPR